MSPNYSLKDATKTVHAVTGRGAKIIRRSKDDTWYLKRGKTKMPLSVSEAACIASEGFVMIGLSGGEEFDRLVQGFWNRITYKQPNSKKQ